MDREKLAEKITFLEEMQKLDNDFDKKLVELTRDFAEMLENGN